MKRLEWIQLMLKVRKKGRNIRQNKTTLEENSCCCVLRLSSVILCCKIEE